MKLTYPNWIFKLAYCKPVRWYFRKFRGLYASSIISSNGYEKLVEAIHYSPNPRYPCDLYYLPGPQPKQLAIDDVKEIDKLSIEYQKTQPQPDFNAEYEAGVKRILNRYPQLFEER